MKKLIIGLLILTPFITFGATQIAKEIKSWDFVAQIQTVKGDNVMIYKFEDKLNDCYVSTMYFGTSGATQSISCVKR